MAVALLSIAAALEVVTGLALLVVPRSAGWLLLGADLAGAAIAVVRFTGIALLALGLGCAFGRHDSGRSASLAAMLAYNALAAAYFIVLGIGGEFVGSSFGRRRSFMRCWPCCWREPGSGTGRPTERTMRRGRQYDPRRWTR